MAYLALFPSGSVFPRNSPTLEAETVVISGKRQMSKGIMNSLTKKIGDGEKKIEKRREKKEKKHFFAIIYDKDFLEENIFP